MVRALTVLSKGFVALVAGAVVGFVGTVMHRASPPWGLVGVLALVAASAVTARAWDRWVTWTAYTVGLSVTVLALTQYGPGGDVLVPDGKAIGWVWVLGSIGLAMGVALLPGRWFTDRRPRHAAGSAAGFTAWPQPDLQPAVRPDESGPRDS